MTDIKVIFWLCYSWVFVGFISR